MRQTILEEVDDQLGLDYQGSKARPYYWIGALTTYGVLLPDLNRGHWTPVGRALAAVQYISCLIYPENENPVFAPWTPNGGGGPPCLWGFEGHLYTHRWLEPNVTFLKGTLNVPGVTEVLRRAVDRLIGQSEHELAAGIREDLPLLNANKENAVVLAPSGFKSGRTPRRASADISGGTLQQDRTCSPA